MTDQPTPNHLRIYRDRKGKHVTLDGHRLMLATDGLFIDGAENPEEVTRVQLTLICPTVTIESEAYDAPPPAHAPTATLPAPADVPVGEPWMVKVDGRNAVGVRDGVFPTPPWSVIDTDFGGGSRLSDSYVTLVSRLVPEVTT